MRKYLAALVLAIGILAGNVSAVSAATPAMAEKLPALYNLGGVSFAAWNLPQVRPKYFYIAADGSAALVGAKGKPLDKPIRWKSWTQGSALGYGNYTWRTNPAPGPYHFSAVTIKLWDVKTHGGARAGVRYYDKMTVSFTQCRCNSHVVFEYYTVGSGKFIAGGWKVISGHFPGRVSPARHGAYLTASVGPAGASASRRLPVAPEFAFKNGRYRVIWGVRPPGRFTIFSGPGVYLLKTRWTAWTATTARATGELWGTATKTIDLGRATIVLSAPKLHHGLLYFSALHILGGRSVVHSWRWIWSGPAIGWAPAT
jgi:hypothetical protein